MRCENEVSHCYQLDFELLSNYLLQILRNDIKAVVRLMLEELKNLRSQVCRSAALVIWNILKFLWWLNSSFYLNFQAWSELFFNLGKALEPHMDNVVTTLLQKSADTNKFIRYFYCWTENIQNWLFLALSNSNHSGALLWR